MTDVDRSWGAVVCTAENPRLYLLVCHASGGHWDHPKGHPEPGESPRDTARREIAEEGGVEVRFVGDASWTAQWRLPDGRSKEVVYFLARHCADRPHSKADDVTDTCWLPYADARERITYESGKKVLDAADAVLEALRSHQ